MAKASVSPVAKNVVRVRNTNYQVKVISNIQTAGKGNWLAGDQWQDTYRGERIAILKPIKSAKAKKTK